VLLPSSRWKWRQYSSKMMVPTYQTTWWINQKTTVSCPIHIKDCFLKNILVISISFYIYIKQLGYAHVQMSHADLNNKETIYE
jgi:hypothetical protein